jgi:YihY family inner membrane protein
MPSTISNRGTILNKVARHPWEFVGWTLLLGYAFQTVRRSSPSLGAVDLGRQKQGQSNPPVDAPHDELGLAGSAIPLRRGLPNAWQLLKRTYAKWSEDHAPGLGAALSYYTVFSLAPLLMIVIAIAGLVFGQEAVQGQIIGQIQGLVGEESAKTIQSMLEAARKPTAGVLATVIATVMLLFGATGVFAQLQESLNIIWKVEQKPGQGLWKILKDRFLSLIAVLGTGFLLLISLVISAGLSAAGATVAHVLPGPEFVLQILNFLVSFAVVTLLFAMIYKLLPDKPVQWGDVWIGASITSLLFTIGKFFIGLYLGKSDVGVAYGAAGSLVVILIWVYYASQIFLFGAEFTAVYAESRGSQPAPTPQAQEYVAPVARPRSAVASFVPGSTKTDVRHQDHKRSKTRVFKWVALTALVLFLLAGVGLIVVNRQLPALIERQLNAHVKGYRFTVGDATLSPSLSLAIQQLTMIQTDHPDPPVAVIPRWDLSIQWSQIFSGVLVSDYLVSRPVLHITLPQAQQELQEEVPIEEKGWREAVYSFYPIKINEFKIEDADVTYVDQDASKPLHFTHLNLLAANIRNVRSPNDTYPSDLSLDGNIFGSGRIEMQGHANFLAEPHAGIKGDLTLEQVALEPLLPVTARYNVQIHGGLLSTEGHLEYSAEGETHAKLKTLRIEHVLVDYIHTPRTSAKETQVAQATVKTAKEVHKQPETLIEIEHGELTYSEFGFINEAAKPPYRVFLSNSTLHLENISNHLSEGSALVRLTGAFMGTGETVVSGTFRPEQKSPDFDLDIKIERTKVRAMNDLFRAYGNFDVTAGVFSLYSELNVKNDHVEGYIKPLFKDMKVYDARQDREKALFHKLYEGLVGGVTKLLENTPRDEVATRTDVSGPLENPRSSTWQTVVNLITNAFFKAVLPGFEKEIRK